MSLVDELLAEPNPDEPKYTPHTEYDGSSGFIQTGAINSPEPLDFTTLLTEFGYDPAQVRIVGQPRISRWQQRARNRETNEFETVWLSAYRFHLASATAIENADLEALVRKRKPVKRAEETIGHWLVFQASDLQLGKRSRDGSTEQIIDRYVQSVEAAKIELRACRRLGIAGVQISMPGDCIEGGVAQGGKNAWLTQEAVTEQVRILRRLMLHTIDEFASAPNVYLDVVNGNHDEQSRQWNTYPGDGWATEAAIAVSDALKLNPESYSHVEVRVPEKWSGMMTVPVGDTNVTIVHGHQWRQENNAWKWWAEQAINHQAPGGAHVMQSGHFHSWRVTTNEHKTHVQSSTLDCGSDWYRDTHGGTNRRGALVYLLKGGEVSRMSLL